MRFVYWSDPHFAPKASSYRIDDYVGASLAKLTYLVNLCNQIEADAVFMLGDLFHHPVPSRTPHSLVSSIIGILSNLTCPHYFVVGNHDLQPSGMAKLQSQPIWTVVCSGVAELLNEIQIGRFSFVAEHHNHEILSRLPKLKATKDHQILLTHASISDSSLFDCLPMSSFEDSGFYAVLFGHMHVVMTPYLGRTKVYGVPALTRLTVAEKDRLRSPSIWIQQDDQFFQHVIPHVDESDIFRSDLHAHSKDLQTLFQDLVVQISKTSSGLSDLDSIYMRQLQILKSKRSPEICTLLDYYLL